VFITVHTGCISEGHVASQRERQLTVGGGEVRATFERQSVDDRVMASPNCIAGSPKGDRPCRSLVARRQYPFQEVIEVSDTLLMVSNRGLIDRRR